MLSPCYLFTAYETSESEVLNDTKLILNDQAHEFDEVILFLFFQGKVH